MTPAILTLAVAAIAMQVLAERLDKRARVCVHPEFTTISLAAYAYMACLLLNIAIVALVALYLALGALG